jgi:hypothetical protein
LNLNPKPEIMPTYAVFLLLILSLAACGGGMGQRTAELLDLDQQAMNDTELQGYYQRLGDQLARESRAARTGGKEDRAASGASLPGEEGEGADMDALRQRWNEVRQELRRRDLSP